MPTPRTMNQQAKRKAHVPALHRCPDPSCDVTTVPKHHFACPADWGRLPAEYKEAILTGYRNRNTDEGHAHQEAMVAALAWYHEHPSSHRRSSTQPRG
jgi:hypothetical protein